MKYRGYDLLLGGLFLALALVFPFIFHVTGLGSSFLPMFYPIIMAGFLISFPVAAFVGIISPLVSALISGMPPFFPPVAFIMMVEGFILAGIPAILYQRYKVNVWITLILTIFVDRITLFGLVFVASKLLQLPEDFLGLVLVVQGVPGIVVILIVVPVLIKNLQKRIQCLGVLE